MLIDSDNESGMYLRETNLMPEDGNERLGKQKLDFIALQGSIFKSSYKIIYCQQYCYCVIC